MHTKCDHCKEWVPAQQRFRYHMAKMTNWEPMPGYDPNLRQFKCQHCGTETYVLLRGEILLEANEEAKLRDK